MNTILLVLLDTGNKTQWSGDYDSVVHHCQKFGARRSAALSDPVWSCSISLFFFPWGFHKINELALGSILGPG